MNIIPPKKLTSQDRILDYLYMRRRSRRRLMRFVWIFGILSVLGAYYIDGSHVNRAIVGTGIFIFLWSAYLVVITAVRLIRSEDQKRIAMEKFILDQGYVVELDDLENQWIVRKDS